MRLIHSACIWHHAEHNAFTDLIVFQGRLVCAFREASSHVSPDGQLRILEQRDDGQWHSLALIDMAGADLRDAKLCVHPDGRLMLMGAAAYQQQAIAHQCFTWLSADGVQWSEATAIAKANHWLWRLTWHQGRAYGMAYGTGGTQGLFWYEITPELEWQWREVEEFQGQYVNEHALAFADDDTAWCLLRRDNSDKSNTHGLLGFASPPYEHWQWQDVGFRIGGPAMIWKKSGEQFYAAYRRYQQPDSWLPQWTEVASISLNAKLQHRITLPSGGDCSYPGLVQHEGKLHAIYYSSHEEELGTAIYHAVLSR